MKVTIENHNARLRLHWNDGKRRTLAIGIGLVLHGNITIDALTSISSILATNERKKISAEANLRVDRLLQDDQNNTMWSAEHCFQKAMAVISAIPNLERIHAISAD
jgi:hypothetical protein